jgi:hypothetical protein
MGSLCVAEDGDKGEEEAEHSPALLPLLLRALLLLLLLLLSVCYVGLWQKEGEEKGLREARGPEGRLQVQQLVGKRLEERLDEVDPSTSSLQTRRYQKQKGLQVALFFWGDVREYASDHASQLIQVRRKFACACATDLMQHTHSNFAATHHIIGVFAIFAKGFQDVDHDTPDDVLWCA